MKLHTRRNKAHVAQSNCKAKIAQGNNKEQIAQGKTKEKFAQGKKQTKLRDGHKRTIMIITIIITQPNTKEGRAHPRDVMNKLNLNNGGKENPAKNSNFPNRKTKAIEHIVI